MPDPARRLHPRKPEEVRLVPSFRWLQMVLFRERVVRDITALLARQGHRLPARASLTLKRLWLTMDVGTNAKRIGLLHNTAFWTDEDLRLATLFFIKLDMRFLDPVAGQGEIALRKLLLGQRSLSALWRCLRRTACRNPLELAQMFVRYDYRPAPHNTGLSLLGVPADEIGAGVREGWGSGTARLLRPDRLVMQEGLRRGLQIEKHYLDMMLYGYIDLETFENIPVQPEEMEVEDSSDEESMHDGARI